MKYLSIVFLCLLTAPVFAEIEVINGNAIRYKGEIVYLAGYITPRREWHNSQCYQDIEKKAQSYLKNLLNDKTKRIEIVEKYQNDKFKVAQLFIDKVDIAEIMLKKGVACRESLCGLCLDMMCPNERPYPDEREGGDRTQKFRFSSGKSF